MAQYIISVNGHIGADGHVTNFGIVYAKNYGLKAIRAITLQCQFNTDGTAQSIEYQFMVWPNAQGLIKQIPDGADTGPGIINVAGQLILNVDLIIPNNSRTTGTYVQSISASCDAISYAFYVPDPDIAGYGNATLLISDEPASPYINNGLVAA